MFTIFFNYIYQYGAHEISFKKEIVLPCIPFLGFSVCDYKNGYDKYITLKNDDYTRTEIFYDVEDEVTRVEIYYRYPTNVAEDVIDDDMECFEKLGWYKNRDDSKTIKEIAKRHYNG